MTADGIVVSPDECKRGSPSRVATPTQLWTVGILCAEW